MRLAKRLTRLTVIATLVFFSGCGDQEVSSLEGERNSTPGGVLVGDDQSRWRAELAQADRDFVRRVRETGLDGFVAAFAEDGMVLPADGPEAVGAAAIREMFGPLFAEPGFDITWAPAGSGVAASGDLGYTYGDWKTSRGATGAAGEEVEGKYVTIWRRDVDGRWRVVLDIGNSPPDSEPDS